MSAQSRPELVYYPQFREAFLHCPMAYECSADWLKLLPTEHHDVRNCTTCQRDVHFCTDQQQLDTHADQQHCVAFYEGHPNIPRERPPEMRLGIPSYRIDDGIAVALSRNKLRSFVDEL
ncbi:hypothetical protein [Macromonas bipunctata]|uniref:hypothetical protein n=1 Tax=Macromonas bipunctata TaxID=183670 RepID=UPI000C32C3A1|nr:hypothetical protein [Macromonas bipunctata]